jgi:NOL1/NOP2/fmu family ribosome biogenesis protein
MFKALGSFFKNKVVLDYNDPRILDYLHGEEIMADSSNGYGVLMVDNLVLGGFKASNGHLKNHYPKGLRNMNKEGLYGKE